MRKLSFLTVIAAAAVLGAGCAGPQQKLGRGFRNMTEFTRLGEIRRTMEQDSLFPTPEGNFTTGFLKGFNRSVVRTLVGAFEIATFPIPSYDPFLNPDNPYFPGMTVEPVYPEASMPGFRADPSWSPDTYLGFSGGDVAPGIPGNKFRIYDY